MNTKPTTFRELFETVTRTVQFRAESLILDFTDQVVTRMHQLGISRSALASKMESSPAYVTKMLGGGTNFTVESLVKVSDALNADVKIEMVPRTPVHVWIDLIEQSTPAPKVEQAVISKWRVRRQADEQKRFIGPICFSYRQKPDEMYLY
jgi:transcriptional regulator with XRE-family HTH domain